MTRDDDAAASSETKAGPGCAAQAPFRFPAFRPHQREIIESLLAGQDVVALLPTGGGKSLCYQLPAIAQDGLTVVISPLIALMKDQVDSLEEMGVPATFLNSSLAPEESRSRWIDLCAGRYKILYLAPERLVTEDMLAALSAWNVGLIAVDEAHCISEWGHDFRPEYRAPGSAARSVSAGAAHRPHRHGDRAGARRHRRRSCA